ncbi:uncharacterized protein [Macrobrachium rosenbergii]|uniref:uncharacterized protein n=1 Tax=Macrobrachium rosenbergii TaxID=79674 RepID=UPI0034D68BF3
MDLLSNFCESSYGHRRLLVVVDELTRFVEIFPLKHRTEGEVALHSLMDILVVMGLECLADVMGIRKVTIIPYRPQATGLCERANRKVTEALRMTVGGNGVNWDRYIPKVKHSTNSMFSDTIGMSPSEALLGCSVRGAFDLLPIPPGDDTVKSLVSTAKESYARPAKNFDAKT